VLLSRHNGGMSEVADAHQPDKPENVVEVSYTLDRREADSVLREYWRRRMLKIGAALVVLVAVFARSTGPPYWAGAVTGVLLVSTVLLVVILIWNRSKRPSLLHHFHWKWTPGGVQVDTPSGTWRYHWSAITSCKISGRFLRMRTGNGTSYHVPIRAFASDSELGQVIRLSSSATQIDIRPATEQRH
jgi:hypothetical protein